VLESAHDLAGPGRSPIPRRPVGRRTVGAGLLALPADALTQCASAGAPAILEALRPEWFVDYGSNAEMRWDSVDPPELTARLTDVTGRRQPLVTPYDSNGYFSDDVMRHPVSVV
jgi:hypothetical protein